jgi:WD40 repeat protein/tRNA A-37 threonylcarbamoyl transferase component Bud32
MTTCPDRGRLEQLLENRLGDTELDELEQHVEGCAACQQTLDEPTVCGLMPGPDVLKFVAGAEPGLLVDPLRATAVATAGADEHVGRAAPMVAGYEIEGELGRGGMGVVYKARHVRLNRAYALEMILAGAHASPEDAARFVTEAEAIARLAPTHIVQIHHIGEADGLPYFELEYLAGGSLDRQLDGTPWPATRAARLAEQVALGIAEAHRHGIVHRDLKPSNVLLAAEGTPKVGDFGLAKMLDSTSALTQSESVMGSPSYMAPEQAQGRAKNAGPAVDVYAAGAILYELLTGRPPFRGTTALETLEQVKTVEPVRPSRLVPGLPRDIETICLKCLRKEPGKRYASALALGEELRRFQDGRPILARRSTSAERFWRWCRRNPGLAAANVAAAALVTLLFLGTLVAAWTFRNQRDQIRRAEHKTREGMFESLTAQARATRFSRQAGQRFDSLEALDRAARIARELKLPQESFDPLRDQAIACLALPDMGKTGRVIHRPPGVVLVAFDLTMTRYALRFHDGTVLVKNVDDNQEIARFRAQGDRDIFVFGFSPDGRYLATTHFRGFALTVWDIDRRAAAVNDPGPVSRGAARFSPDSRRIALAHEDGEFVIYDLPSGRPRRSWRGSAPGDPVFSPDGTQIAVVYSDPKSPTCQILEAESGRLLRSMLLPTSRPLVGCAWSPEGTTLAVSCDDFKIYLWDAATGIRKATLEGSTNAGLSAAFHPAGTLLASNGWEGRLRLWDAVLGRPVLSLTSVAVNDCRFSQDGRIVVSLEDELTTYQVDPALEYRTFAHVSSEPIGYGRASIRRDGRLLAACTSRGVVLWDSSRGKELAFLPIGHTIHLMFEASGALLTSGSAGVRRWPVQLDFDRGEFHIGPPRQLRFPRSRAGIAEDRLGRIVALANFGATHVLTPDRKFEVRPLDDVRSVAVSPDGKWLATGSHGHNGAQVWRIGDAARVADLRVEGLVEVAFSPDGKWLLTSASPCRLWEVGTWREARQIRGWGLCFSPDGRLLAVMDARKVIHLVETESGRMVARLESPDSCGITCATFSPDGSRLVVTSNDLPAAVHVWDLRAIRKRLAAIGLDWDAPAYSDDDPASPTVPPLPPLQVDLGPLAGEMPTDFSAPSR